MKKINSILILAMLLVTSCASIVNEDTTKVKLMTSTGEKTDVTIDGISSILNDQS